MASPRACDIDLVKDIVTKSKVFIDTCSLMHEHYAEFEPLLFSTLRATKSYVIVPAKVIEELNKYAQSGTERTAKAATYALKSLSQNNMLINIKGDESDNFADNVFQTQFSKFRLQYDLTLITQDVALAHDILALNSIKSQRSSHVIKVFRITSYGTLGINDGNLERCNKLQTGGNSCNPSLQRQSPLFSSASRITTKPDSTLPSTIIPHEGDILKTSLSSTDVGLTKLLGVGGEGMVFETSMPDLVCKIYNNKALD